MAERVGEAGSVDQRALSGTKGPTPAAPATKQGVKKATEEYDSAHPDLKALEAEGVPATRVHALAHKAGVTHPAVPARPANNYILEKGATGETNNPSSPAQYAGDILLDAGLPDTPSNESLLERQMSEEGMPGSENNPLASSLGAPGSKSINSAGVQEYPTPSQGAMADAMTLKTGYEKSLFDALQSGKATPQQYAAALAASNYEGLGGSSNPANVAYAASYLGDQPATSFPGGGSQPSALAGFTPSADGGAGQQAAGQVLDQASSSNLFGGLNGVIPQLGTQSSNQSLQQALQSLSGSQATLTANTTNAPGSPDQPNSQVQQTSTPSAAQYQQALALLLPNLKPGAVQ